MPDKPLNAMEGLVKCVYTYSETWYKTLVPRDLQSENVNLTQTGFGRREIECHALLPA